MVEKLNKELNRVFKNLSISKINYTIDFWHLEFKRHYEDDKYKIEKIDNIWIHAHEIEVNNENEWIELLKNGPFDLTKNIDYKESIKALVLFNLAREPIQEIEINKDSDLILKYSENQYLKICGKVDIVDWIWWIDFENEKQFILNEYGKIIVENKKLNNLIKIEK
ncbi:hypothetical protein [Aureivirga sp. CE67]|uniref:hypothetical protein n=1 Tax=Aureivirga sp. CE67 TaxID=1788983 RepID=UPI0018C94F28|nr:hypothetical protein [Aureivirga sp. CE67]